MNAPGCYTACEVMNGIGLLQPRLLGPAVAAATLRHGEGRVGGEVVRFASNEREGVLRVRGKVAEQDLDLNVRASTWSRRVDGSVGHRRVDLESERDGDVTRVTGAVGTDEVDLQVRAWSESQVNITGHVGNQAVRVFVHRQIDGHVVDGFAGGRRIQLRDRDIEGQLALTPADYLPALLVPPTA